MANSQIQPGAFVYYDRFGMGKVTEAGQNLSVRFWAKWGSGETERIPARSLKELPDDSPEVLLWDRPSKLESWADKKPLKLVALAVSVRGSESKCKLADVKKALDGVPGCKAGGWWATTQAKLRLPELEGHFGIEKTNISLHSSVYQVPDDADLLAFLQSEWQEWLWYNHGKPVVWLGWPNKESFDALDKVLAKSWTGDKDRFLSNTLQGAQNYLGSGRKKTPSVALNWLETLSRVHLSWDNGAGHRNYLAGDTGETLIELSKIAGYAKAGQFLFHGYTLKGMPELWMQGLTAGMWASTEKAGNNDRRTRRDLFRTTSALLGRQSRADLAREIAFAAVREAGVAHRYFELEELDQVLEQLTPGEEAKRLVELMALSSDVAPEDKNRLLDYVANSRHATGPERLNLLVLATLLLTEGNGAVAAQASRELDGILAKLDKSVPTAQALFRDARARVEGEVAKTVDSYDRLLEREKQEQGRLRQLSRDLTVELKAKREESRLEIRQDMLLAIGEVLQTVVRRQASSIDELAGNVEAGLTLALKAGDADLLSTTPEGKVVAPGVIVRGGIGDRVLLKPQIVQEAS